MHKQYSKHNSVGMHNGDKSSTHVQHKELSLEGASFQISAFFDPHRESVVFLVVVILGALLLPLLCIHISI